jgi:lipid-A-disaccharide synthase
MSHPMVPNTTQNPIILFLAGDPSGDQHAAPVVRRLREVWPLCACEGIGGPAMQAEGFRPLMPFGPFNHMGFAEVFAHLPFFLSARRRIIEILKRQRPSALVCVDYPGFNIPLMKIARRLGVPVVWYIVPQVWAWKKKRAAVLARHASFIGTVFPFEVPIFAEHGASVRFVGHPLVEALGKRHDSAAVDAQARADRHARRALRLAIVPGSRVQEIRHMLAPMIEAWRILKARFPAMTAAVSRYAGLPAGLFAGAGDAEMFEGPLDDLLARSDLALVTSGTATLQTALHGVPLVIAYRTSGATFALLKRFVKLSCIGLPNIVAGRKIVPECIQAEVTGEHLAAGVRPLIESRGDYFRTVDDLLRLREKLGSKKPSEEIAQAIMRVCGAMFG